MVGGIFALSIIGQVKSILVLLANEIDGRCHLCTTIEKNHVQIIELVDIIFVLSIEVLVGIIFV